MRRIHLLVRCILQLQARRLADWILLLIEIVYTVCKFDVAPTLYAILLIIFILRFFLNRRARGCIHDSLWIVGQVIMLVLGL